MRTSIRSLIDSVLSDQKRLLTRGKRVGGEASAAEHTEFRGCYKVVSSVVVPVNEARRHEPALTRFRAGLHLIQRVMRRTYAAVNPAVFACWRRAEASAFDV